MKTYGKVDIYIYAFRTKFPEHCLAVWHHYRATQNIIKWDTSC